MNVNERIKDLMESRNLGQNEIADVQEFRSLQ